MITSNTGEWSELYALGVIISQGGMYASDNNEQINYDIFYKVLEAIIESKSLELSRKYIIGDNEIHIHDANQKLLATIQPSEISKLSKQLFKSLSMHNEGRAFSLDDADILSEYLHVISHKSKSTEKSDISLIMIDNLTKAQTPKAGFSIKSQIGAPATLVNASAATNFTYRIVGDGTPPIFIPKQVKKNTQALYEHGFKLELDSIDSDIYTRNMRLIDSNLPEYMAELLVGFYQKRGGVMSDVIDDVFTDDKERKTLKVKEFLVASALGMMPDTKWDGQITNMGGFILVKKTGDVLCFYLYNMSDFQDYLLKQTKFDTPSTTRYGIGSLIQKDNQLYMKLNLQIRFRH